jgi:hypothetical protein
LPCFDRRGFVGVAALAVVLTLLAAAPVITHPTTRIFGNEVVGRHHDPFTAMARFRGAFDWSATTQPATDLPGSALSRLVGPVAAFNVMVLVTFPLAALAAYALTRHVGASRAGAALAGLSYSFSAYHLAHAAYHPHVAQVQWLPLYLLTLWRCLEQYSHGRAVVLAAAAGATVLADFYAGLIAATLTPVAVLGYVVMRRRAREEGAVRTLRHATATSVVLVAIAALGVLYVAVQAPWLWAATPPAVAVPATAVAEHGALWPSYVLPPVEHPWLGEWSRGRLAALGVASGLLEQQVAPGWSLLVLAGIGVALSRRVIAPRRRPLLPALLVLAGTALVLSLAPGQGVGPFTLPAPSLWIHDLLPVFRAFARYAVVVGLVVSVLAGLGLSALLAGPSRASRAGACLAAALVCFELAPVPWRFRDVLPTAAHRYVAELPGRVRVLDSAPISAEDVMVPVFMGQDLRFRDAQLPAWDDAALTERLGALGVTHVIVRRPTAWSGWREGRWTPEGMSPVRAFPDGVVFRFDARAGGGR